MNAISRNGTSDASNRNLAIWLRNEATDPSATKPFSRGGGFKGTATNPTYIVKRLTVEFGPVGLGWGVDVVADDLLTGAAVRTGNGDLLGNEIVHRIRVRFWWLDPETKARCAFDQIGQTTFVGRNKNGWFTDEEAPKKSLTDALTKAASWLGFAADIHLGLWDDSKYVAERVKEEKTSQAMAIMDDGRGKPSDNGDNPQPIRYAIAWTAQCGLSMLRNHLPASNSLRHLQRRFWSS